MKDSGDHMETLEQVSAETALAMQEVTENKIRRMRDGSLVEYLLKVAEEDRKSIICKIMSRPDVLTVLADWYGLTAIGFSVPEGN